MSLEPLRDAYFPTYFSLCSTNIDKIPNSCIYSVTYCKAKGLSWSWWYLNLQLPMQSVPIVSCDLESHSGNTTFINISVVLWRSVLLVEETGVPGLAGENHRPAVSDWQTLSNIVLSPEWDSKSQLTIGTDCIGSCKFKYHQDHDSPLALQ
jgi:hypothetical protein